MEVPSKKMVSSIFPADREEVGEGRAAEGRTLQALFLKTSVESKRLLPVVNPPVTMRT